MSATLAIDARLIAAWHTHARGTFPRECFPNTGGGHYLLARTEDEYLAFCSRQHEDFGTALTSLYPSTVPGSGYRGRWGDVLMLELDGRDAEASFTAMRRLYAHLKLTLDAEPRIYFSGRRSFHMYYDFLPVPVSFEALSDYARRSGQATGTLDLLDFQMYHPRRMGRIPYTTNEKTGRLCVPVELGWSLAEVLEESSRPTRFPPLKVHTNDALRAKLWDATVAAKKPKPRKPSGAAPSCSWIEHLLRTPLPDGRHRLAMYVLTPYLARKHGEEGAALAEAVAWLDLQKGTTLGRSQLRYMIARALSPGTKTRFIRAPEDLERFDPQLAAVIGEAVKP